MPMRYTAYLLILTLLGIGSACVDPEDISLRGGVDLIVVDATITDLAEPQRIQLNHAKADPVTGRFGSLPLTKASVAVRVDSAQLVPCQETGPGTYQLPANFRGQVGHAYQLQFSLGDGTRYVSTQQVMPFGPPINKLTPRFNATSLPAGLYQFGFRAGYDLFISTPDPAQQRNYYRWDWALYEKQIWCRTCYQGIYVDSVQRDYIQNGVYVSSRQAVEDCFPPAVRPNTDFWNDYRCRTPCWDILHNYSLSLFDDQLTNGALLNGKNVAQVPLFTRQPALLEVRQGALTADAYRYLQLFQQQTQNTGGLADTPPTALPGNVRNVTNPTQSVIGYFTASAVSSVRYWLDKKDATTLPLGAYDDKGKIVQSTDELYYVQNRRTPNQGPEGPPFMAGGAGRLITAPCIASDNRTPLKPPGWRD